MTGCSCVAAVPPNQPHDRRCQSRRREEQQAAEWAELRSYRNGTDELLLVSLRVCGELDPPAPPASPPPSPHLSRAPL